MPAISMRIGKEPGLRRGLEPDDGPALQPSPGESASTALGRLERGAGQERKNPAGAGFLEDLLHDWCSLGDSNPCFSLERATS